MKQTLPAAILSLALTAGFVAPASAADKGQLQMMADIRMLQEQAQQLQILLGSLNEALKAVNVRFDVRFDRADARLGEQAEATRKAFADQKLIVDTFSSDLRVVREKVDDSNVRIGSLTQEVDALRRAVQQMNVPRPATTEPDSVAVDASAGGAPPPAAAGALAVGMSPQRLWDEALAVYYAGQYDLTVIGFESYIRSFPKSDLADDAQVYVGNSYLNDGKNDKAVDAYDLAIRTYPSGNAIPEAYFKKGLALKNLKQVDRAREAFEYVVSNYPDSDAGRLAKQQLAGKPQP